MAEERSPLENEIRRLIVIAGPMSIAEYMRLCLTHPQYGYYVTRDPLGVHGDFVTAPEISQMFGELIGLWIVAVWQQMGSPENVRVVELGPGRGTLMVDALRAAKVVGDFHAAVVVHLVEISPKLQQVQQQRLESLGVPMLWHTALADVPSGPAIIIANEFVDALPVHQAVKQADGWHERVVEIAPGGNLAIGIARDPLPHFEATLPRGLRQSPEGSVYEWRSDTLALEIGRRVRTDGAALIIDYGHAWYGLGETLQAVAGHSFTDPLRAGRSRSHRACRFRGAGAERANYRRAHPWPYFAARSAARARHRQARGCAQGARAGESNRDRPGARPADRDRAPRHGRVVQGARHRRPEAWRAAGL